MPIETPSSGQTVRAAGARPDGFAPLRIPLFRYRWIASTISQLGTWMQDTAGTWLMATLTSSPLLIALMLTAASLPMLLLGLVGGATADILDRRKLILFWQSWMLGSVAILSVLTLAGDISPWALLTFTFLLNVGSAMNNPAWQAIVPELVPRALIPEAVVLNAGANNLARAAGPALGGLLVAAFAHVYWGAGTVFLINSISFAAVIWVIFQWKRTPLFKSALPSERLAGSILSGLRYLRHAPELRASLTRAFTFTFFVSGIWSLLAVVAKNDLRQGAFGYGILNGSLGTGAVVAAMTLPRLRHRVRTDHLLTFAIFYEAAALAILAYVHKPWIVIPALLVAGFSWTTNMSTLNTSVQLSVPAWVQARSLGAYILAFQGGMALGSILWGFLAKHASTTISLTTASLGLALSYPIMRRFPILQGPAPDNTPSPPRRPAPELAPFPVSDSLPDESGESSESEDPLHAGPVRISIAYHVPPENYAEFTRAIHQLRAVRLRDGAIGWGVYRDAIDPEHLHETFIMESWLDYLRSRERITAHDAAIRARVRVLHRGGEPPKTTYQIYAKEITPPEPKRLPVVDGRSLPLP